MNPLHHVRRSPARAWSIDRLLLNYANNAVKFTEKGEIVISVRASDRTEKDVLLRFRGHLEHQLQALGVAFLGNQAAGVVQQFLQFEVGALQVELAGLPSPSPTLQGILLWRVWLIRRAGHRMDAPQRA